MAVSSANHHEIGLNEPAMINIEIHLGHTSNQYRFKLKVRVKVRVKVVWLRVKVRVIA